MQHSNVNIIISVLVLQNLFSLLSRLLTQTTVRFFQAHPRLVQHIPFFAQRVEINIFMNEQRLPFLLVNSLLLLLRLQQLNLHPEILLNFAHLSLEALRSRVLAGDLAAHRWNYFIQLLTLLGKACSLLVYALLVQVQLFVGIASVVLLGRADGLEVVDLLVEDELVLLGDEHLVVLMIDDVLRFLQRILVPVYLQLLNQLPVQLGQLVVLNFKSVLVLLLPLNLHLRFLENLLALQEFRGSLMRGDVGRSVKLARGNHEVYCCCGGSLRPLRRVEHPQVELLGGRSVLKMGI